MRGWPSQAKIDFPDQGHVAGERVNDINQSIGRCGFAGQKAGAHQGADVFGKLSVADLVLFDGMSDAGDLFARRTLLADPLEHFEVPPGFACERGGLWFGIRTAAAGGVEKQCGAREKQWPRA